MEAVEALALVAGHVDEELLLRNEYLAAENEILRSKLSGRPQLTNSERIRLAKLGKRLGLKALKDIAAIVKPETILAWYRKLVAKKFDGSAKRGKSGRPRVEEEVEKLSYCVWSRRIRPGAMTELRGRCRTSATTLATRPWATS